MKILVLSSCAPTFLFYREDMMTSMKRAGHHIVAGAPESVKMYEKQFNEKGFGYVSISEIDRNGKNPLQDIKGIVSIVKAIKEVKPDKIFAFQAKTVIYGAIASKICGIKEFYAMMSGLGSILRSDNDKSVTRKVLLFEYKVAYKFCKKVFFQNSDDFNLMYTNKTLKKEKAVFINGTGVNLEKFNYEPIENKAIFLFIGRILKDKGIVEYIKAAKVLKQKYPYMRCQILGSFDTNPTGIKKETIEKYVNEGIIEYLGETTDVRPYLKACSVFVLPSYHEGTPKSVLEAMATGRPIITTDAPGCRETVVDGENGFLVPVKNYKDLAKKMIWMVNHNEEIEFMGEKSYNICKVKFDVKKVNETILTTMGLI